MEETSFTATLHPSGLIFAAPASLPLLQAALRSGIRLVASCRNGTCRACMCRLNEGRVRYRIQWPGLSAEEKVQGVILPCVAHPESNVVFEARVEEDA